MTNHLDFVGRLEHPTYNFDSDSDLQPTLDGLRGYGIFLELVPEIDERINGRIDTALMYGSGVNGYAAFPDSQKHNFDSDVDLFLALDSENFKADFKMISNLLNGLPYSPEINIDIRGREEFKKCLRPVLNAENDRDLLEADFEIKYQDHYMSKSAPKRLRAFSNGYVPHPDYNGLVEDIDEALLTLETFVDKSQEVKEEYNSGRREYDNRVSQLKTS